MSERIFLRALLLEGPDGFESSLAFEDGLNVIWGASNTGKTFALRTIDFMLGASNLTAIREIANYSEVRLRLSIGDDSHLLLSRSTKGGALQIAEGADADAVINASTRPLKQRKTVEVSESLSALLLERIGMADQRIASDTFGTLKALSFRHLSKYCLVDETSMFSERSPINGSQRNDDILDRSVFRLLISGSDDSSIRQVTPDKKVRADRAVRVELLDSLAAEVGERLRVNHPEISDYSAQLQRLDSALSEIRSQFRVAQGAVQDLIRSKQTFAVELAARLERVDEIGLSEQRFQDLDAIYVSDLQRLESLEEAGFLLTVEGERDCPLCGAIPEHQSHTPALAPVQSALSAAVAEMAKIHLLRAELAKSITDLAAEQQLLLAQIPSVQDRLARVDEELGLRLPNLDVLRLEPAETAGLRDRVRQGLALEAQWKDLIERRDAAAAVRVTSKSDKPNLSHAPDSIHEFCREVQMTLLAWGFPGQCQVSFDNRANDIVIDGVARAANGKGVRAISHAAFKISVLTYCRKRGLPHPGFVVLDTPLLTYRDPEKNIKHGPLAPDEQRLATSKLRDRFFAYLVSIQELGQTIVLENVDPPDEISSSSRLQEFTGNETGRWGLLRYVG